MRSALLCATSAEKYFLVRVYRGLRAAIYAFFTGGVVTANGSCRAGFLRKQPRGGGSTPSVIAYGDATFPKGTAS